MPASNALPKSRRLGTRDVTSDWIMDLDTECAIRATANTRLVVWLSKSTVLMYHIKYDKCFRTAHRCANKPPITPIKKYFNLPVDHKMKRIEYIAICVKYFNLPRS